VFKNEGRPIGSVSVGVQKKFAHLHSDLEFWTLVADY